MYRTRTLSTPSPPTTHFTAKGRKSTIAMAKDDFNLERYHQHVYPLVPIGQDDRTLHQHSFPALEDYKFGQSAKPAKEGTVFWPAAELSPPHHDPVHPQLGVNAPHPPGIPSNGFGPFPQALPMPLSGVPFGLYPHPRLFLPPHQGFFVGGFPLQPFPLKLFPGFMPFPPFGPTMGSGAFLPPFMAPLTLPLPAFPAPPPPPPPAPINLLPSFSLPPPAQPQLPPQYKQPPTMRFVDPEPELTVKEKLEQGLAVRSLGTVNFFNCEKGWGFITDQAACIGEDGTFPPKNLTAALIVDDA
ncbi:hypothetical protein JCM11641_007575 [Rhodosporidiobolus odoratus]